MVAGVEHENVTKVDLGGAQQVEPVYFGAGERPLVRQHNAFIKAGQFKGGDHALAGVLAAIGQGDGLVKDIEGWPILSHQDALLQPGVKVIPCAGIDIVLLVVTGLFFAFDDAHDAVPALSIVFVLQPVPHPVVGLADDG